MQRLFTNRKLMNKKGIFYSITVLMFMLFLLIYFNTKADIQKKEDEFHIERVQMIVMDHFVRDFDSYYIEEILFTAAKPAMIKLTSANPFAKFTKENITDLMVDGECGSVRLDSLLTTNDNLQQALGTITFNPEGLEFSYAIASVEQPTYDTIQLNFLVNYSFSSFNTRWSKRNKPVNISFTVYSLTHPDYHQVIESNWVESDEGCYLWGVYQWDILSEPTPDCDGMNIRHPCGNGVIDTDKGEVCDGDDFDDMSCADYGFTGGSLLCINCQVIDSTDCTSILLP